MLFKFVLAIMCYKCYRAPITFVTMQFILLFQIAKITKMRGDLQIMYSVRY